MEWDSVFDFFRVRLGGAIIDGAFEYQGRCAKCNDRGERRCVIIDVRGKDGELHECDPRRKEAELGLRHIIPFIICDCKIAGRLRKLKRAEVRSSNGKSAE